MGVVMNEKLIEKLKQEMVPLVQEAQRLRNKASELQVLIRSIERKRMWVGCWYRYGDILEVFQHFPKGESKVVVATQPDGFGRKFKKDGTLYAQDMYLSGIRSWNGSRPEGVRIVGRYEGPDLPKPDEAQQFGLDNR